MPLPAEVRTLISAKFDPKKAHPLRAQFLPDWTLYRDLMELDRGRLKLLVDKHAETEDADKYKMRQLLGIAYNLIPMVLNMARGYIFAEEPSIQVKDETLLNFLGDCDQAGTTWVNFVRQTVFPMSMGYGMVDVLVQNPFIPGGLTTAQDERDANISPFVTPITPIQRLNWSARPNHEYNWMTFQDVPTEPLNPFGGQQAVQSYVTVSSAQFVDGKIIPGYWMRSIPNGPGWEHDGEPTPMARAPIATLYYQRSNDPDRRHHGISKISMMAVLTLHTIQLLSWISEDILANLSLLGIPTRDGKLPKKDNGDPESPVATLGAFSVVAWSRDARSVPQYIQGATAHIVTKMKHVEMNLREIQRLAGLISASGSVSQANSGIQAVVQRTELFQELSDQAGALDGFTYDVLALVKSWATGEDWDRKRLREELEPVVSFFKGPYVMDPLPDLIQNVNDVARIMGTVTPTLIEVMQKQLAQQIVYADDPARQDVMDEIETNSGKIQPIIGAAGSGSQDAGETKPVSSGSADTSIEADTGG